MKIVIVGGGKVGSALTAQLTREGHDIVLVDINREKLRQLEEANDIMVMYGNGASLAVQREAEVDDSDLLIAVTPSDELNMICCMLAQKLGCSNTIARVRNPEYAEQLGLLQQELGLSLAVNPEMAAAAEIFRLIQLPAFLKRELFAKGRVEIVEIDLRAGSRLDGARLSDLRKLLKIRLLVSAVRREEKVYIPDGSFQLHGGDRIYVTAAASELPELIRAAGLRHNKTRRCMIIGGGKIGQYLSHMLITAGIRPTVIEKNAARSQELAELLPVADIINADGTSKTALDAAGIQSMDSVVTLTDVDEENIIVSMYAKYLEAPQVITKINRSEFTELFQTSGFADSVVSPKLLCANLITQYVRAMQNKSGGSVLTLHHLADGQIEALEFNVTESTHYLGRTLTQIQLKPNILIACIFRMGRVIIPEGNDAMESGDTVVVVTASGRIMVDLNDIFAD